MVATVAMRGREPRTARKAAASDPSARAAKNAAMTDGNTAPSACAVGPSYVSRMLCSACGATTQRDRQPDSVKTPPAVMRKADKHHPTVFKMSARLYDTGKLHG